MRTRSLVAVAVTGCTVLGTALALPTAATAGPSRTPVPHSTPSWTGKASHVGHAGNSAGVTGRVYLQPKGGEEALKDFALAVSTPGSGSYGQFLSAAQYAQRFNPTAQAVKDVSTYLASSGLRVSGAAANNRYVSITGTVKDAETAFAAPIDTYRVGGELVQAPSATLSVPSTVAPDILAVTGLDTTTYTSHPDHVGADAPPAAGFRNARPCGKYYGQVQATTQADFKTPLPKFQNTTLPYAVCGYTGPQFRAAYEGNSALDGSGVTVGIVDAYASPTIASDANTYASQHGDGSYRSGQLVQTVAGRFTHQKLCGPSGWYGEETLDVEAVHAMAPGANIHYYGGASCLDSDFLDTLTQVVDDDAVQIVSNSYGDAGENADATQAYESVFLQGAAEGISFLFSSGDSGDELANTGIKQVDSSASDPYVTAVGGTATAIGANGSINFQTGWGTDKYSLSANGKQWTPVGFLYGAGGGESGLFNQPAYQAKVTSDAYRQVPDVAMDADPTTGMLVGQTQTFSTGVKYDEYRIGGTSLASPLFAGMTALALQHAGGKGAGLLNPVIYANTGSFTDVKGAPKDAGNVRVDYVNGEDPSGGLVYSVRTFDQDSSLQVTKGYDQVTGVGVPNTAWLTTIKKS